jgi:hypothetical protein
METINAFEIKGGKQIFNEDGKNINITPHSPTGTESTNEDHPP